MRENLFVSVFLHTGWGVYVHNQWNDPNASGILISVFERFESGRVDQRCGFTWIPTSIGQVLD